MNAVRRLFLVRHAGTAATRQARFAVDEPLAPAGLVAAAGLAALVPRLDFAWCSPTLRTRETAAAAGWQGADDARLRPLDLGSWVSKQLPFGGTDPLGMVSWLSDPAARPHGGETIVELIERIGTLLADWHDSAAADLIAVTHAAVVRAAVVVALGAPPEAFWRVEAAPASVTELHTRGTGWVLVGANLTSA